MSMPYVDDEIDVGDEVTETTESPADFPIEGEDLAFDFEAGDIVLTDGDVETVWDEEALKQWIIKALSTRSLIYEIYLSDEDITYKQDEITEEDLEETDEEEEEDEDESEEVTSYYGLRIEDIAHSSKSKGYRYAMIQKEIEETLLKHPDISAVKDFSFVRQARMLCVDFRVETTFGTMSEGVSI